MKLENNKNIIKLIKIYNIENSKLLTLKNMKIIFKIHIYLYVNKIRIIFQLKI